MSVTSRVSPWRLTHSEARVMDAMLEHGCHKAVASALSLTQRTVEHHCQRAGARMRLTGRNITKYLLWDRWRRTTQEPA